MTSLIFLRLSGFRLRASASVMCFSTASLMVGDLVTDDAHLAGRLPAADLLLGGAPHGQLEGIADVLAAERALHPHGAVAARPSPPFGFVRAVERMAPVDLSGVAADSHDSGTFQVQQKCP